MSVGECRYDGLASTLKCELDRLLTQERNDVRVFAMQRLQSRFAKKFAATPSVEKQLSTKCIEEFIQLNQELGNLKLTLDPAIIVEARNFIEETLWRSSYNDSPQQSFSSSALLELWRFGPGASVGASGTHSCYKIGDPLVCTKGATPWIRDLVNSRPDMKPFSLREHMAANHLVQGSRITSVPKNQEARRIIAIEPLGNMALQLAFGRYVEDALRMIGLDIQNQQIKNRALAREGSITRRLSTLDMSKASDSITLDLIDLLWPKDCAAFMRDVRSPSALIGSKWHTLNMLSTMGNGFTFPVMTLTFLSLMYANYRVNHGGKRYLDWKQYGVFGDDIIVPTSEIPTLIATLEGAGFKINLDKSCTTGDFRESCGGDFFNGECVSPFYIKDLRSEQDIYVAINQVLTWSAQRGVLLLQTVRYLIGLLRHNPLYVPEWMPDTSGIRTQNVPRRYSYIRETVQKTVVTGRLSDAQLMRLICGGYVNSDGFGNAFATTRESKVTVKVCKARLPDGWTDGWEPRERTRRESLLVAAMLDHLKK